MPICKLTLTIPQPKAYTEVIRLLGYPSVDSVTPDMQVRLERAWKELAQAATPRSVYTRMEVAQVKPFLQGQDIQRHLKDCTQCVLLAVTLGTGVISLIRRAQAINMADAVLLDAAASVMIEGLAEEMEQQIKQLYPEAFMTGRYSPGYGDWGIQAQTWLTRLLDTSRQIGLAVTDSCLLTPSKSITALCGVADHPVTGQLAGCRHCALRDKCQYRKEGKTCG